MGRRGLTFGEGSFILTCIGPFEVRVTHMVTICTGLCSFRDAEDNSCCRREWAIAGKNLCRGLAVVFPTFDAVLVDCFSGKVACEDFEMQ